MPEDDYQNSPDERDTMTDEELLFPESESMDDYLASQAQQNRLQQALLANEAMRREEAALDARWLNATLTAPPEIQQMAPSMPQVSTISSPRNRIYMGPMVGAPNATPQDFFGSVPSNTNINLMPPPSPEVAAGATGRVAAATSPVVEPPAAMLSRLQAADQPGTRTIGVSNPPMPVAPPPGAEEFEIQQGYLRDVDALGVEEAKKKWMPLLISTSAGRITPYQRAQIDRWGRPIPITDYQRLQASLRQQQLAQQNKAAELRAEAGTTKQARYVPPGVATMYRALVAEELLAKKGYDEAQSEAATKARKAFEEEHPEIMGRAAASTTTTVTAPPAVTPLPKSGAAGPKVHVRNPQGKTGWIPESQLKDALAAGWTRL